ncbi:ankyrin repeat and LEM domain-containing protein 2-like isoform X2 [Hypomesus transpacificus]|uniref:ankyrin repeat and LEM domain-containing protein 2-like isoform X2 n=1 Tax=Hypomesus transpacificus TaxID=137520 RepID=UPI001F0761D9|nr:ankyrin repeat and LEM domain-containing protein 2-like isoform X2 [Hypomesus transpacificus]
MDELLSRLGSLTSDQLRQEVIEAGLNCGPITATTRAIFERKLARTLLETEEDVLGRSSSSDGELAGGGQGGNLDNRPDLTSDGKEAHPSEEAQEVSVPDSPPVYYGVCPPKEEASGKEDKVRVYVDMKKALRAMITVKGARFKAFSTREEAETFAKGSSGQISAQPTISTLDGPQTGAWGPVTSTGSTGNLERANEFRSPRTQDLTAKLRKAVEQGDQDAFRTLVWSNPRYLIGSGDNPTIVHEGCHYNALHVAAKENQAGIAQLLLDTLENPDFMRLMYPDDQEHMLQERIHYIVDLYLNTPDKASNETPLHYACKFGCPDVVNVLCSHPATDKHRKNKYNQKPPSVICERKNKSPEIRKQIRDYLEDRCYVPLLRDTDNSFQPVIGLPWSPDPQGGDFHLLNCGEAGSPIDPVMTVKAYVGPLSPSKAEEFYKLWKSPSRERAMYFHGILKSDPDRGVERVGREIAHDMGHPWAEYWGFLDSFVDLSSEEGLVRLEDYLKRKDDHCLTGVHGNDPQTPVAVMDPSCPPTETSSVSPVCNLLPEFERASLHRGATADQRRAVGAEEPALSAAGEEGLDLGDRSFWRTWGRNQGRADEELSSACSEEYLTADEGSERSGSLGDVWTDRRCSESSSSSSYKSTGDTSVNTVLTGDTPTTQTAFIQGQSPTKLDRDVLDAVKDLVIDPEKYPCITKWKDNIQTYPSSQRLSWPSPTRSYRETQEFTPSTPRSTSPGPHSPTLNSYTQHILRKTLFRSPN